MGFLSLGIVLIVVGILLAFTNLMGFAALGGALVWLGWICIGIGIILAILHFVLAPRRTTVVEREVRRPPTY
jgi:amino acid transporter